MAEIALIATQDLTVCGDTIHRSVAAVDVRHLPQPTGSAAVSSRVRLPLQCDELCVNVGCKFGCGSHAPHKQIIYHHCFIWSCVPKPPMVESLSNALAYRSWFEALLSIVRNKSTFGRDLQFHSSYALGFASVNMPR